MKILYVVNNAFVTGNGLSASCRRTVHYLREAGEDVRILSARAEGDEQPDYPLSDMKIPLFDPLIKKQGYSFAKTDDDMIRRAVSWADIVHLEEPFFLQIHTCRIAEELGVPMTATYHLHPENLFSSVGLRKNLFFNRSTMRFWRDTVFNRCEAIQCPTENVRERLRRWHFQPELRLISNGMIPTEAAKTAPLTREAGIYTIVTTGRYSVEKDQITLLRAMRYSKYADKIRLVFAGRGPTEKKLHRMAEKLVRRGVLKIPPVFLFSSLPELIALYRDVADLYIHCATVEVEGLACTEAIGCGLVPIISQGRLSATAQFALSEKSVFPERRPRILAERIDYWLSDDERRRAEAKKYIGLEKQYDIEKSIAELISMYRDVLAKTEKEREKTDET